MSTNAATVHDAVEWIYQRGAQLAPVIQSSFADVEQWDADTLIRRYCILRANLRDTIVRVCGVLTPTPDADLAWWRVNVADPADERVLKLRTDPTALPRLLIATLDNKAVHVLIGGLMGYHLVSVELLRRLEASKVSQTVRALYSDPSAEKTAHVQLLKLIGEQKEAKQAERGQATYTTPIEGIESEEQPKPPSDGVLGLFERLDKERLQGRRDADDYSILAGGPLAADRVLTLQQWERVAADLLVEDIRQREQGLHRALLTPDLDVKAIGSAKDAERKQHREGLALERGGPGTVEGRIGWKCVCKIFHRRMRDGFICPICRMEQPEFVQHVPLDSAQEELEGRDHGLRNIDEDLMEQQRQAAIAQRLANVQSQLPVKVVEAFRLIADENLTLMEAAQRVKIDERTLRRWRKRIRGQDPEPI